LDPSDDFHIIQLNKERTVGASWPWIHPHCHLLSPEWLNATADKGLQEVRTYEAISM
jgi:hypothetical protein